MIEACSNNWVESSIFDTINLEWGNLFTYNFLKDYFEANFKGAEIDTVLTNWNFNKNMVTQFLEHCEENIDELLSEEERNIFDIDVLLKEVNKLGLQKNNIVNRTAYDVRNSLAVDSLNTLDNWTNSYLKE
jgi:hypothetical protein